MAPIIIPADYGYVLLAVSSTFFVNMYHMAITSKHRKSSGVKYPSAYASQELADKDPKAYKFNCAQRAHANFTENLLPAVSSMLIAGLRYPVASGIIGGTWAVSRVLYAWGYTSDAGPSGRYRGGLLSTPTILALGLMAAYTSVKLVLE